MTVPSKKVRRPNRHSIPVVKKVQIGEVEFNPAGEDGPLVAAAKIIEPHAADGDDASFEFNIPDGGPNIGINVSYDHNR